MLINERIRQVRVHRKLQSKELARIADVSAAEISLLESKMRMPKIDTLQKLAAALEVTISFLVGEEDADIPVPEALASQSLKLFLRSYKLPDSEVEYLKLVSRLPSAPTTIQGWSDLMTNISLRSGFTRRELNRG